MRGYLQFIVLRRKNRWTVKSGDQERVFPGQLEAIEAGVTLANECGKNGKPSVVVLQRTKSRFDPIWTYGRDSYPPKLSALPTVSEDPRSGFSQAVAR
jgi:hypothetical protein